MTLRKWLKLVKINTLNMSKILGCHRTYLYKIMLGERKPSRKILDKIKTVTQNEIKTYEDLIDKPGVTDGQEHS